MHHAHAHSNAFHRNFSFEIDSLRLKRKENFKCFYLVEMKKKGNEQKTTRILKFNAAFCGGFRCFARACFEFGVCFFLLLRMWIANFGWIAYLCTIYAVHIHIL